MAGIIDFKDARIRILAERKVREFRSLERRLIEATQNRQDDQDYLHPLAVLNPEEQRDVEPIMEQIDGYIKKLSPDDYSNEWDDKYTG